MKHLTGTIELIAHVEIDPNDFRQSEKRSSHKIPRREQGQYWAESFAQIGICDLRPLEPTWWVVPIRDIYHEVILHHLIEGVYRIQPDSSFDEAAVTGHISGGLSLVHDGEVIIASMCCSDLSNIESWNEAVAYRGSDWHMLWNGHPWVYVRYEDGDLLMTDYTEGEPRVSETGKYAISAATLQSAVKQARRDLYAFKQLLMTYAGTNNHHE
jgi:hypothetical protein